MQLVEDTLFLSASDLIDHLECAHLTRLEHDLALGITADGAPERSASTELIIEKGEEHERAYLQSLKDGGEEVVEIESGAGWEDAAKKTRDAMRAGAEVIYQGLLFDGHRWRGYADFLHKVETPSDLGDWSYEVSDAKLARRVKPYYLLQLCLYSDLLAQAQGLTPRTIHVVLGSNERHSFRLAEFDAYYRRVKERFEAQLDAGLDDTYPNRIYHCQLCRWAERCDERRLADDHLGLVAHMRQSQIAILNEVGIETVAELGEMTPDDPPKGIACAPFERLRLQAKLQTDQRLTDKVSYDLLTPEEAQGFARLPAPSEGDLFFDMEGDPFFDNGLEYLFGVISIDEGEPQFKGFWAMNRAEEKLAFEDFMDFALERLERYPDAHIYHYAPYEPNTLKRLMGMHATREDEVDHLLRQEKLVDLYKVVRQGIRISQPSYSLKKLEPFYMRDRDPGGVTDGGESIVEFERYLDEGDEQILEHIERYNEDDCRSTLLLRDWLLERREEAIERFGAGLLAFKTPPEAREVKEEAADAAAELDELRTALAAGVPVDLAEASADERSRWLLAQVLDYHRREAKPAWWAFFDRLDSDLEALTDEDNEALGGLREASVEPEPVKRSLIHTLEFPPQDHKIGPGGCAEWPTGKGVNVESIDDGAGTLRIVRGARAEGPLPVALIPGGPFGTKEQEKALRRFGADVVKRGVDADGRYRAVRDILRRALPRTGARAVGEPLQAGAFDLEQAKEITAGLDDSYLFIQGPPGSGKTYAGAHLILDLLARGARVGVASGSHKAINNLLGEVERFAEEGGLRFSGLKKTSSSNEDSVFNSALEEPWIENSGDNADFVDPERQLVAGTAWLFARDEMDGGLDHLFVDEAGQVSLADALAIGTSARNIVFLGDPLQLAQVSQAKHPPGSGLSVLEHLLGDETTVPADRGLFIDQTRRMHPDVCSFISETVYEGRLESHVDCARQAIEAPGELTGTGVRWIPVEHDGNTRQSIEEAEAIATRVGDLVGYSYMLASGETRPLVEDDVMVVTPYNAQVRCLRERLPSGVRVGTVDKFQGQEAAIVFFSMATSSGAELPRNLEFLFSRNRLNVAISRARCLAVLVCSAELLEIRCRSAEQMQLVNALCRLAETATSLRHLDVPTP